MKDIENINDIKQFVNSFYGKIREDEMLAPVFALRIKEEGWAAHLQKMYGFWNTVLFRELDYKGNPFPKHMDLPVQQAHFDRWVSLFNQNMDALFAGTIADEAKMRAKSIAGIFSAKIEYFQANN